MYICIIIQNRIVIIQVIYKLGTETLLVSYSTVTLVIVVPILTRKTKQCTGTP